MAGKAHISPTLRPQHSYDHDHLYTFDGNTISFRGHPYIWSTTILYDKPTTDKGVCATYLFVVKSPDNTC